MVRYPGSPVFADQLIGCRHTTRRVRRMWETQERVLGRRGRYIAVPDLDRGQDIQLAAELYSWPGPNRIQLCLGVRTDIATAT
jgi:hypothetical protein